jgi:hypothetical protein
MAKRTSAAAKTAEQSSTLARRGARLLAGAWRLGRRTGPMLLLLGGAAAGLYGIWWDALAAPTYRIRAGQPRAAVEGMALQPAARRELARLARLAGGENLLNPRALGRLREAYEENPWIERTYPFRRDFAAGAVVADYLLRLPAAQVAYGGRYWLVDEDGVLLTDDGPPRPRPDLPVVHCPMSAQPPVGQPWRQPELLDALAVLEVLRLSPLRPDLSIARILAERRSYVDRQLRRRRTRPRLTLYTETGAVIRWGAFNRDGDPEEPLPTEKLEMLRRVLETDGLAAGEQVDVSTHTASYSRAAPLP